MYRITIIDRISERKYRSTWQRGVAVYAIELLASLDDPKVNKDSLHIDLLNGAKNWQEYSYGGNSLIYDKDIALRLCTISELKKTKCGDCNPNKNENWLDIQARALSQAEKLIMKCM